MSQSEETPQERLPPTLTVAGIERELTFHLHRRAGERDEITLEQLVEVLENWVMRGVRYADDGRPNMAYLGWVEHGGSERLMRVGVSMDDRRITTAFLDTKATDKLNSGDMAYFQRNYERLEVRDESESSL